MGSRADRFLPRQVVESHAGAAARLPHGSIPQPSHGRDNGYSERQGKNMSTIKVSDYRSADGKIDYAALRAAQEEKNTAKRTRETTKGEALPHAIMACRVATEATNMLGDAPSLKLPGSVLLSLVMGQYRNPRGLSAETSVQMSGYIHRTFGKLGRNGKPMRGVEGGIVLTKETIATSVKGVCKGRTVAATLAAEDADYDARAKASEVNAEEKSGDETEAESTPAPVKPAPIQTHKRGGK